MSIDFTVNGKKCSVSTNLARDTTLNAYIRYGLALPGTKAMCHEGGCGSCVVTVRAKRQTSGVLEVFSVNSCLVLVFSCNGWEITTIEGLGNRRDGYDEIQKRVVGFNATQCGYCTPGWSMHLNSLRDKHLTMAEMERSFGSNTCRCTGFRPIMDTVKSFAVDCSPALHQKVQDIEDLFQSTKKCLRKISSTSSDSDWSILQDSKNLKIGEDVMIELHFENCLFFKVFDENQIFEVLSKYGEDSYMLVDGNTAKGIFETFEYPKVLLDISDVRSLKQYEFDQNLILGANIAIEDCINLFNEIAKQRVDEFSYLEEFAKHLELVAHIPVRKIGSLAGNLMTKHLMPSYQSDVFLLFAAIGAGVTVRHSDGKDKYLTMTEFLHYDMTGVLLLNIELPPLSKSHIFKSYKIMPRNQNALAIVNAAFLIKLKFDIVEEISIVYGNISAEFNHAYKTETYLKGKELFTNATLQGAIKTMCEEISPENRPPEPSSECRKKLAIGLFYKFVLNISPTGTDNPRFKSGGCTLVRDLFSGHQDFQTDEQLYPLNAPVPKYEALIQSSGEAQYVNDIPPLPREVFGAFVLSTVHNGELNEVYTDVLKIKGVLAIYTAKDIPGINSFSRPGIQLQTEIEEILASKCIKFYGQPVAIVVAETEKLAADVAKKVKVTYKNISNYEPVLTIDQAKKDNKRYQPGTTDDTMIKPKGKGTNIEKVIKGTYEIEAQYHYYLEPITSLVVPIDRGFEVYDSTQWVDLTQISVAQCLGINESKVLVKVRRVGGGFGGKLSRNAQGVTACALVASKLDRPCRFILPMQTNLTIPGRRLPCQCNYEVGVDHDGKIQYLNSTIVEDDGCSHDENILSYTAQGFPNCYNSDYFDLKTAAVLTDLPSNTFARAPGTAEGISSIEHIMEHIAFSVCKDPIEVKINNLSTEHLVLKELIEEFKKYSDYDRRCKDIALYNQANRWTKKAMKIALMAFPVIFYGNYSAMISVYRGDATVTVTTGGVEMGQGVNTKAQQVCAYELGIPLECVSVLPMFSFVCANNVFSGSSIVSESVCYAIIRACRILKSRLQPIKEKMTNPTWKELIKRASDEEIDLTAKYMMNDKEPDLSGYTAYAVTILETELDILTGRFEIRRTDILEDVGLSANPNIDIGQVEGAFVQGLGYFTTEKLVYCEKTGRLLTNRSLNYHVPLCLDIPADFRIKLRYNSKNPKGVLGSKAVGEMGICTANVITHALRQCIYESRVESGCDPKEWIYIHVPYDTESILQALDVKYEEMVFV